MKDLSMGCLTVISMAPWRVCTMDQLMGVVMVEVRGNSMDWSKVNLMVKEMDQLMAFQ